MRTEGEITKDEYLSMREKIDKQIVDLKVELDSIQEESDNKTDIVNHYEEIKIALEEAIDFSQSKLPDYIIDRFVNQITPVDNNTYRWFINIIDKTVDMDNPNEYIEELSAEDNIKDFVVSISGRKNNPKVMICKSEYGDSGGDDNDKKDLSLYQNSTGSYITKIGEFLHYNIVIPFEEARSYRKSSGRYLRCNQWDDLTVEVYLSI